jgi:site-specific DNA-methyltransferase (adenine-specific)
VSWDLRLGSCLDPVSGLASLMDLSVDVTITDPPYEAEAHTKGRRHLSKKRDGLYGDGRYATEAPIPFAAIGESTRIGIAAEMARVTRRWILVFCQVEATHKWAAALEANGAGYIRTGIWLKHGTPQFTGDRPGMGYESIVIAHRSGRKRWNGGGKCGVFKHNEHHMTSGGLESPHPTTKPLALMSELVDLFSEPGETVLDPFAGSGSTGVACNRLGRNFIGWELDANYHAIATRRFNGDEAKPRIEQPGLFDKVSA